MRIEFDVSGQQWIFQLRTIRYIFASIKNVRFHNQRARLKTSSNTLKPVDDRITFNRELVLNPSIWDGTGTETVNTTAALTENIQFNIFFIIFLSFSFVCFRFVVSVCYGVYLSFFYLYPHPNFLGQY